MPGSRTTKNKEADGETIAVMPQRVLLGMGQRELGMISTQYERPEDSLPTGKVLNELDILPDSHVDREKPFYRRTTFVVSLVVSLVVILAGVGWLTYRRFSAPPTSVTGLRLLEVDENTLLMSWNGPNVPYQAVLTTEDARDPKDITQMIRGLKRQGAAMICMNQITPAKK